MEAARLAENCERLFALDEELADLLEVIRACTVARGYSVEELEQVRADKAAKRGGFEKKILLKQVEEA